MQKTTQHSSGVRGILARTRQYNPEIGNYMEHFINERFSFTVRLSNGRIEMPMEMAHDQETMPSSISEDRIQNIAQLFQDNNPRPALQREPILPTQPVKALGFWERLLKWLGMK
jgi:hypothetical protein